MGVSLIARDVDSDNDFDIVVTSSLLKRPIQVWINDGPAVFTRGTSLFILRWRGGRTTWACPFHFKLRVVECPSENQGGRYALTLRGSCAAANRYNEGILRWSFDAIRSNPVEHGRSRAPPALS